MALPDQVPITGRTRHGLLTIQADTGPEGMPRVAGHPWHTPAANAVVDTGDQDLSVFRHIRQRFGNQLTLKGWGVRPGIIHLDDPVGIEATRAEPARVGGWILGATY